MREFNYENIYFILFGVISFILSQLDESHQKSLISCI